MQFQSSGPAGPIVMKPAPAITTEAAGERLVIKNGKLFVSCQTNGDMAHGSADGLYSEDTRFLSSMQLTIGGKLPVLLSSTAISGYSMHVNSTNSRLRNPKKGSIPQQTIGIGRVRLLDERMFEEIIITNYGSQRFTTRLEIVIAADFADTFEVRRVLERPTRGEAMVPRQTRRGIQFAYRDSAGVLSTTSVDARPQPDANELTDDHGGRLAWDLELEPTESMTISLDVSCQRGSRAPARGSFRESAQRAREEEAAWSSEATSFSTDNERLNEIIRSSIRDMKLLMTPFAKSGEEVVAAGIPWYVAPFGRDSVITSYESLIFNPDIARKTLEFLARYQAREDDVERDAEPGKILHEIRYGELARAGLVPHTPYYGSVDSTPLFLMLAGAYYRWTADLETLERLLPAIEAGLTWIDRYGDSDGDGFVEYSRRSGAGLLNQGWKDSEESMMHADGSAATGPIALAEVQGYTYMAKVRAAELYRAFDRREQADELAQSAERLKEAYNASFWMPDEGTYALALDGDKRQVRSVTSNPGHCLYCGIVDSALAPRFAERLMADDMFSGWGIRTLSKDHPSYNPMSYHNGSVWPHDNAIIAAGLKRYGFIEPTERLSIALLDAALVKRERRLPELVCGFAREPDVPYVDYPVACLPQAWATAVPFILIQAMLGISARAHENALTIAQPSLPRAVGKIELSNLRVGDSRLGVVFRRDRERTSFALLEREGSVRLTVEE